MRLTMWLCFVYPLLGVSSVQAEHTGLDGVQWFIQDSAYTSLDNALTQVTFLKEKYEKVFLTEDEWSDGLSGLPNAHVSVHEQDGVYKVIIGPYARQDEAKKNIRESEHLPLFISLQKYAYDNFDYGYRFTLSRISPDEYQAALAKRTQTREGLAQVEAGEFVKSSADGSLRFVRLPDGDFYIEQVKGGEVNIRYALAPIFQAHGIERIDLDDLVWTSDNRLLFYDVTRMGFSTYDAVYALCLDADGQWLLNKAEGSEIRDTKRFQTLTREKINVVEDFAHAKKMLKGKVTFFSYTENGTRLIEDKSVDTTTIEHIRCANGEEADLSWVFGVKAYFPQEHVLLTAVEGFNEVAFSTQTCQRTNKNPYAIRYAPDRRWRLSMLGVSETDATHYVIEFRDEGMKQYVPLRDIDAFFTRMPDIPLEQMVWFEAVQAGEEVDSIPSLYFPVVYSKENIAYYAVKVEALR